MIRPLARGLSLAGLATSLAVSLAACSGTPLGERLSGSFSAPATPSTTTTPGASAAGTPSTASPGAASSGTPAAKPGATSPSASSSASPSAPPAKTEASTAANPAKSVKPAKAPVGSASYRITIKLPTADPSAPAEVVTEALRSAGVSFEVETIERMPSGSTPSAAAASGTPAAPASSPAPAPR
ncbi:hypothetical protein FQK07_08770 [Synechococcus sp. BSF8S]|uniref:hypothetical protein n=1 Tax=Synechococcales TaxID=1890424 RepID=UPI00162AB1D6|nr:MULTISPECIES: hypothetical protein [unclassified Synechococcus]MBC1261362.1 hypothetical protein [Synechococcus sp. BSF8S]MBC1264392.1 hypothetical protein [Synechococcus sp. BSA11S]